MRNWKHQTDGLEDVLVWITAADAKLRRTWEPLKPQTSAVGAPRARYGHVSGVYGDMLIVSHGYAYDHLVLEPLWLSDTWALSLTQPYRWRLLHAGLESVASQGGILTTVPSGRMGATAVIYGHCLTLFGGTDGGFSSHGQRSYEAGHAFDDLYELDLITLRWGSIMPVKGQAWPTARHLHVAARVGKQMVVAGGLLNGQGDVWSFDLDTKRWKQLAKEVSPSVGGPRSLVAAAAVPDAGSGSILVFGGRAASSVAAEAMSEDLWLFKMRTCSWHRLRASEPRPPALLYHSMTRLEGEPPAAVVMGGSTSSPGLVCSRRAWRLEWNATSLTAQWAHLPDFPLGLYSMTAAAGPGGNVFSFGGHMCVSDLKHAIHPYNGRVHKLMVAKSKADERFEL